MISNRYHSQYDCVSSPAIEITLTIGQRRVGDTINSGVNIRLPPAHGHFIYTGDIPERWAIPGWDIPKLGRPRLGHPKSWDIPKAGTSQVGTSQKLGRPRLGHPKSWDVPGWDIPRKLGHPKSWDVPDWDIPWDWDVPLGNSLGF
ncbi:hypothetical protein DFJ43DRAFT_1156108 [Lentinula guzmanii]|uniref:Uncharacterized protein n=1 Tax=Lentinula guzmanii TaxID=2804957 RepID=A0AA38MYI3_9AGAR|nr:hypothetical protein DFJ43DRAFT_1156108 [Lentinula guzmanii]